MEEEKKDLPTQETKEPETEPAAGKKDANKGMVLGLCLGMCIGTAVGAATKNLGLWMSMGMLWGVCLGLVFDERKKKQNEKNDGDNQPQA